MKFSQVIILLTATMAIVAFGYASAADWKLFGKSKPVEPKVPAESCSGHKTTEGCDICCRKMEQFNSGAIKRIKVLKYGAKMLETRCECRVTDDHFVYYGKDPEWRSKGSEPSATSG